MRLASVGLALALANLPYLPVFALPACAQSPLVLNEILAGPARDWDGSGTFSTRDDEWIELLNGSPAALDLSGWLLTDGDAIPRCGLTGTLAPGERRVVTGREAYDWERAHGQPAFGLSLSNTGDRVMLWQVAGPDTLLMDSYSYASHEAAADRAIGRFPDGGGSWVLFDGLNPYTGTLLPQGNRCPPTPGTANACASTPSRTLTWGRLKALYR
jgi:hypothetical protein